MNKNQKVKAPWWLLYRLGMTNRQWKSQKRKELKQVIKAFSTYKTGCAYCPDADYAVCRIHDSLKALEKALSVKEWGR